VLVFLSLQMSQTWCLMVQMALFLAAETFRGKFAAAAAETVLAICKQVSSGSCNQSSASMCTAGH